MCVRLGAPRSLRRRVDKRQLDVQQLPPGLKGKGQFGQHGGRLRGTLHVHHQSPRRIDGALPHQQWGPVMHGGQVELAIGERFEIVADLFGRFQRLLD